jgi:transketolase
LSDVEIFVALYYGGILRYDPTNTAWEKRDRFIVSKGHGGVSLYPILADLGFFDRAELEKVCQKGTFLGGIPDMLIPGFETINGSLGHGLGVACGICIALKRKNIHSHVFVLMGDGELYEGAVWEAIMFAGHHGLDNLTLVIDKNEQSILGYCRDIIDLDPLEPKFKSFGWLVSSVDGHDLTKLYQSLSNITQQKKGNPKVLVAHTVKGKGVPQLENDPLCHIRSLKPEEIDCILESLA